MPYRPSTTTAPPPKQKQAPSPEDNRPGIGARQPPPSPPKQRSRPPQKQAPSPEDVHVGFNSPIAPPPSGPPVPVLQKYGVHMAIGDVNNRVQSISDAYQSKFGHLPSWGLVFDLLRAPVIDFRGLFAAVPHSGAVARAQSALGQPPAGARGPTGKLLDPKQAFVNDLAQAVKDGKLADFESGNRDELNQLLSDKQWATKAARAMGIFAPPATDAAPEKQKLTDQYLRLENQRAKVIANGGDPSAVDKKLADLRPHIAAMGIGTYGTPMLTGPLGVVALGIGQIVTSLAYSPVGLYFTGKAGVLDVKGAAGGDYSFKRTRAIGKQSVQAVARDIRHPLANPGYAVLDAFGLVSAGASGGVRIARAGAALREGEGIGAATRTLASRPVGGTFELRKGDHSEHVLLFDNPVAQIAQRAGLKLRQRALDIRDANPLARQPATSGRAIDLSSEAKLAREAEARKRVERAVAHSYTTELEAATGWSVASSQVFARLPHAIRATGEKLPGHAPFGLTRGEQKAIQVLATDDPNPLVLHRDFHERMKLTPELGEPFGLTPEQFIANHDRHLGDLKMAEKVLDDFAVGKARKRFVTALEETQRVIAEQERLKIDELGLSPASAERRVMAPAEVMRTGEPIIDTAKIEAHIRKLEGLLQAKHVEERASAVEPYSSSAVETKIAKLSSDVAKAKARLSQRVERPRTREEAQARLDELDAQTEAFLNEVAGAAGHASYSAAEQLRRNKINGLIAKEEKRLREGGKGRPEPGTKAALRAGRQPLLSDQAINHALDAIDRIVERNPDNPAIRAYLAHVAEANDLRGRLSTQHLPGEEPIAEPDFGTVVEGVDRSTPESFYLPYQPKRHARTVPRQLIRNARFGPFGVPRPRDLPELKHVFTGRAIIAGDFRIDATHLAGEAYGKTVRLVSIRADHARLLKMAKDTQAEVPREFAVPIREIEAIPSELRDRLSKIDDGEFTAADANSLSPNQLDAILRELYPDPGEPLDGVKWVDARLISDEGIRTDQSGHIVGRVFQGSPVAGAFDVINEPFRFAYLFLRPAYALNFLGNAAMGLIHQGVLLPINFARALHADDLYGADAARALDALNGEGKMQAIAETAGTGKLTATSRTIGHAWSILTDRHFRRAAMIHELRRQNFRTREEIRGALFDKANQTKLVEAQKRANKAMVQFDNLTHYEKAVLRHIIFVYPWVSRSAVWSVRTIVEHPVQSAILAELGHEAEQETDPIFGHTPDWIRRVGYIPIGYNADGSPRVINPTSVNTFSTLNDLMQLARGGETPEDLSSPLVEVGIRAFTGADQYGRRYQGGAFNRFVKGPLTGSVQQVPLVRGLTGPKTQPAEKPLNPADREAFVKQEHAALKASVLGGGWLGNWGSVIGGGASPRTLNLDAAHARYWQQQPLEARNKHERALIQEGLSLQGSMVLKRPPSQELREAVDIAGQMTFERAQLGRELGRDVPADSKQGGVVDIEVLRKRGKLSTIEAEQLTQRLQKLPTPERVKAFIRNLHLDYGGAKLVTDWQDDVNLVASFTPATVRARLDDLRKQGLAGQAQFVVGKPAGMLARGNIDLSRRPTVKNADGSISTVRSITIGEGHRFVLIPTVVGGKVVSNAKAIAYYRRTGQHLGIFNSEKAADAYAEGLHTQQAGEYVLPGQETLYALGRQVLAYQKELKARHDAHKGDQSADRSIAEAELRAYQDSQDRAVQIDGHTFPSVVRMAWSMLTPKAQADHRASILKSDWKTLTAFDKGLLGKTSSAEVTQGWANLQRIVAAFKGQTIMPGINPLPLGSRKIAANQMLALVKYVDKGEPGYLAPSPGFYKDWLFARQPAYRRIESLKPVTSSKFQSQWHYVFTNANVLGSHLNGGVYPNTELRQAWHEWVNGDEFQGWLQKQPSGFRRELEQYGPDFVPNLLN